MRTIYTNIEKTSRFTKGIRAYVIILFTIIVVLLGLLWVTLFRYQGRVDRENNQEEQEELMGSDVVTGPSEETMQRCFEEKLENMTLEDWTNAWYAGHPEHFDKDADVISYVQDSIINQAYDRYKAPDFSLDMPKYLIATENGVLAEFALSGSGDNWEVSDITINLAGDNSVEITFDDSFLMYLNDSQVSEEHALTATEVVTVSGYDDQLIMPHSFAKYRVDGLISPVEPSDAAVLVTNDLGGIASLAADGVFYGTLDNSVGDEYRQKANDFIKALLDYYSKGKENAEGNMYSVLGHVASGSEAAKIINNSLSGVVWRVADYSVSYGTECSPVYVLADNCYCVDVAYTEVTPSTTYEIGDGIYRVYFINDGNGFKIVQFAGIQ